MGTDELVELVLDMTAELDVVIGTADEAGKDADDDMNDDECGDADEDAFTGTELDVVDPSVNVR